MAEDEIGEDKAEGKENGHESFRVVEKPFHDRSGSVLRGSWLFWKFIDDLPLFGQSQLLPCQILNGRGVRTERLGLLLQTYVFFFQTGNVRLGLMPGLPHGEIAEHVPFSKKEEEEEIAED